MAKTEKYPGALSLVYSRPNQAWFVMWHDQVLRVFNRKDEAREYALELTRGASTDAEHEAILRKEHPEAYEPNAQSVSGSEVVQRLRLLDIGQSMRVDGQLFTRVGRDAYRYEYDGGHEDFTSRKLRDDVFLASEYTVGRAEPELGELWWTSAPEAFDYDYVTTVVSDVPGGKYAKGKLYRLISVTDPARFRSFQAPRYSSGLHVAFPVDSEEAEWLGLPPSAEAMQMKANSGGYVHCECGGCFDETIASNDPDEPALCELCEEAGCEPGGECQCEVAS